MPKKYYITTSAAGFLSAVYYFAYNPPLSNPRTINGHRYLMERI